jgi:hypothetical protein
MTSAPVKLTRERFKAAREGKPYDPPAVHADKLVGLLAPAAQSDPAPDSPAFRSYIAGVFSDRLAELCASRRRS